MCSESMVGFRVVDVGRVVVGEGKKGTVWEKSSRHMGGR
jgi:hypothetical protein